MNAVEIEEAVSELFTLQVAAGNFAVQFFGALGNIAATIDKLKKTVSNLSDFAGGVLQCSNIHMAIVIQSVEQGGDVTSMLNALRANPKT